MANPYQLYYSPGACSLAVHVLLHELNQPVTTHKVDIKSPTRDPDFLKLNPRGQVPTLILPDGTVMTEVTAILTYLADAHPSGLFPAPGQGAERATALRWLSFCNDTLHGLYGTLFGQQKAKAYDTPFYQTTEARINSCWQQLEQHLATTPYLNGWQPGVADILLTVIAGWPGPQSLSFGPQTRRVLNEIAQRPTFQESLKHEAYTYKLAA